MTTSISDAQKQYIDGVRPLDLLDLTNLTSLTNITYLTNLTTLTNKQKILIQCITPKTISEISTILNLNVKNVGLSIQYKERGNGLFDEGLLDIASEDPRKYVISKEGEKILFSILKARNDQLILEEELKKVEALAVEQRQMVKQYLNNHAEKEVNERKALSKKWVAFPMEKIMKANPNLADAILDYPEEMLACFEIEIKSKFDYNLEPKFMNLPSSQNLKIGDIRIRHLRKMFSIDGIIKQTSQVKPRVTVARFECPSCGTQLPVLQLESSFKEPSRCSCGRKGSFSLINKEMVDLQIIKLEELPEQLNGRTNTQQITVVLKGTLCKESLQKFYNPGSRIRINGIIKEEFLLNKRGSKDVNLSLMIEANYIEPQTKVINYTPTEEERKQIISISKSDKLLSILTNSFLPDLHDMDFQKLAIMCSLVKGTKNHITRREEIHTLFVGEPGLAKSDLLTRTVQIFSWFCRYANGSSSSSVGLTASVIKDEYTGLWSLNAGTVVMANEGVCCVDEIDKMRDEDKNDLNECAEQGTVTISKAGISGSLQAKTTLIVASNPKDHSFNEQESYLRQINLPFALITRFDLIFLLKNSTEKMLDLMDKIVDLKPSNKELINEDLFVKYILMARQVKPKLTKEAQEQIKFRMRGFVEYKRVIDKEVPLTIRQLHAMTRLSTAFAKLRLSEEISKQDVSNAWDLYINAIRTTHLHAVEMVEERINKAKIPSFPVYPCTFDGLLSLNHAFSESELQEALKIALSKGDVMESPAGYYRALK